MNTLGHPNALSTASKSNDCVSCVHQKHTGSETNLATTNRFSQALFSNIYTLKGRPSSSSSSLQYRKIGSAAHVQRAGEIDNPTSRPGRKAPFITRLPCSQAMSNGTGAAFDADDDTRKSGDEARPGPQSISASVARGESMAGEAAPASGTWPLECEFSGAIAGIDQSKLASVRDLAESDSRFVPFRGIDVHYKQAEPFSLTSPSEEAILGPEGTLMLGTPAVLLHGFGASLFSWHRLISPLASLLGSPAVAFDRPAFGLTERVKPPGGGRWGSTSPEDNPYSATFSADCARAFSEYLLSTFPPRPARKVVLVAHSAGAAIAAQAFLESPTLVAALVLIGPALSPPLVSPLINGKQYKGMMWPLRLAFDVVKAVLGLVTVRAALGLFVAARYAAGAVRGKTVSRGKEDGEKVTREHKIPSRGVPSRISRAVLSAFTSLVVLTYSKVCLLLLYVGFNLQQLLVLGWKEVQAIRRAMWAAGLRSIVGRWMVREAIARGGTRGVRMSWAEASGCDEEVLKGYTKPLKCHNWDRALIELIIANSSNPPVASRLSEIKCPVLVITGDKDRIVPPWNAKRLSKALPRATLVSIRNCGHLPHEEKPAEVINAIRSFLAKTFTGTVPGSPQFELATAI